MESKKLSCEKALFLKNISKCWFVTLPIFGVFMYWFGPTVTFGKFYKDIGISADESFAQMFGTVKFASCFCILLSCLSFGFLHKWKSVSFYSSLPTTRFRVFKAVTLSNIFIIFISTALCVVPGIIMIKANGLDISKVVIELFVYLFLMQLEANAVGNFFMILSGKTILSVLFSLILNEGGYNVCSFLTSIVNCLLGNGEADAAGMPKILENLTLSTCGAPYESSTYDLTTGTTFTTAGVNLGMKPETVFFYLIILTVVFLILGGLVYKKMQNERIGKAVTVKELNFWVKLICAVYLGMMTSELLTSEIAAATGIITTNIRLAGVLALAGSVLFTVVFYFIFSFVEKKRNL